MGTLESPELIFGHFYLNFGLRIAIADLKEWIENIR